MSLDSSKRLDTAWLENSEPKSYVELFRHIALDTSDARLFLRCNPGESAADSFVRVFTRQSYTLQQYIARNLNVTATSISVDDSRNSDFLFGCIDLITKIIGLVGEEISSSSSLVLFRTIKSADDRIVRASAEALAFAAPPDSYPILLSAIERGKQFITPYLAIAKSKQNVIDALDTLALIGKDYQPDLQLDRYVIDYVVRRSIESDAHLTFERIAAASMNWSPYVRTIVGDVLSDADFESYRQHFAFLVLNLKKGQSFGRVSRSSTWRRLVALAKESGSLKFYHFGFSEIGERSIPQGYLAFRDRFTDVVARSCGREIEPHHHYPRSVNEAVDSHFSGQVPLLDLQWATDNRKNLGDLIRFGSFSRFAVVCSKHTAASAIAPRGEFRRMSMQDGIAAARSGGHEYTSGAISFEALAKLNRSQSIKMICQTSSALNELVLSTLPESESEVAVLKYKMEPAAGELAFRVLREVLLGNDALVAVVEWNLIQDIGMPLLLAPLIAEVRRVLEGSNRELVCYKGFLEKPIDVGYFAPRNDDEFYGAAYEACQKAYVDIDAVSGARSWNGLIKDIADRTLFELDGESGLLKETVDTSDGVAVRIVSSK